MKLPATTADLADLLGCSLSELLDLSAGPIYTDHTIRRRRGSRPIAVPLPRLAEVQRRILDLLPLPAHEAAHGYLRGRSPLTATAPHLHAEVLVTLDLASWFASITRRAAERGLVDAGYASPVAEVIGALTTRAGRLPQGPCTSPAVSNVAAAAFDAAISAAAAAQGIRYTRYADDLLMSGPGAPGLIEQVRQQASSFGWSLNDKKTRIMRAHERQHALGIVVNGSVPTLPREERRRLRAAQHQAEKAGDALSRRDVARLARLRHINGQA